MEWNSNASLAISQDLAYSERQMTTTWTTRGFESFRQGVCGNAGQNLYVSRAGVLQRIHQYDLNGNGYLDLLFCNSQNHSERPPAYVYDDPLGHASRTELAAEGAWTGTVADLNGDSYDDLVSGDVAQRDSA